MLGESLPTSVAKNWRCSFRPVSKSGERPASKARLRSPAIIALRAESLTKAA